MISGRHFLWTTHNIHECIWLIAQFRAGHEGEEEWCEPDWSIWCRLLFKLPGVRSCPGPDQTQGRLAVEMGVCCWLTLFQGELLASGNQSSFRPFRLGQSGQDHLPVLCCSLVCVVSRLLRGSTQMHGSTWEIQEPGEEIAHERLRSKHACLRGECLKRFCMPSGTSNYEILLIGPCCKLPAEMWCDQVTADSANDLKRGTRITLFLKEDAKELADDKKLGELIKQYSEFIQFPIRLWQSKVKTEEVQTVLYPVYSLWRAKIIMGVLFPS